MGVRTYEVTVSRKFIVKGCSNKKQVEAKAPEQLRQGEYLSEITEVKPVYKELPMPDVSAVTSSRKRQPKITTETILTELPYPVAVDFELSLTESAQEQPPVVSEIGDLPEEVFSDDIDEEELDPGEEKFYENVTEVDFKNKVRK